MTDTIDIAATDDRAPTTRGKRTPRRSPRGPAGDGVAVGLAVVIGGVFGVMATYGEWYIDALVFLAVFAGLAVWAARRPSRRVRWVIAGLLTIFVGVNLMYAIPDLAHPDSPAPFLTSAIVVGAGAITATLAVLAARGRAARGRVVWLIALGGFAALAAASLTIAAGVEDDQLQPGDTEIVTKNIEFPQEVTVDADSSAVFIRNEDRFRHTFVVEGAVDPVELPANSDVRVELDLAPGAYRYFCDIQGHENMEGTLVVR